MGSWFGSFFSPSALEESDRPAGGIILLGLGVLGPCLVGLLVWSFWAPLSVAAIANGEIVVEFRRKTVQHLEGGIVDEILVREGQLVEAGAPLLRMADLSPRGQAEALSEKISHFLALEARLKAEMDGADGPDFGELSRFPGLDHGRHDALERLHRSIFEARRRALASKIALLISQKQHATIERDTSTTTLALAEKKRDLLGQEYEGVKDLFSHNVVSLSKKREMEAQLIDLDEKVETLSSARFKAEQAIASADSDLENVRAENQKSVLEELQSTEVALEDAKAQWRTLRDDLARRIIRSPVRGKVMDIQVHAKGAVVAPGGRLLDVVPEDERPLVEARVSPNDIDLIHKGSEAKIALTAYRQRHVPKISGTVVSLSGDALVDEARGERYYLARIHIHEEELRAITTKVDLYPGMPIQAFLLGEERTFADYILQPIFDTTYRAFREE